MLENKTLKYVVCPECGWPVLDNITLKCSKLECAERNGYSPITALTLSMQNFKRTLAAELEALSKRTKR